jgi:hypothetical protein
MGTLPLICTCEHRNYNKLIEHRRKWIFVQFHRSLPRSLRRPILAHCILSPPFCDSGGWLKLVRVSFRSSSKRNLLRNLKLNSLAIQLEFLNSKFLETCDNSIKNLLRLIGLNFQKKELGHRYKRSKSLKKITNLSKITFLISSILS